jgi:8-oxo-dGTP pyrophosphatase MutT (NUDIX family)
VDLVRTLTAHASEDEREAADLARILAFVRRHPLPFDRGIAEGHLTGSALVVDAAGERVLLLHHRKLQRWLQPGGHADPGEDSGERVALREAREETGIEGLRLHPGRAGPLDVDVHDIPARPGEPAHQHLDLRYLVVAPAGAVGRRRAQESSDLRWFSWAELAALDLDPGLRRALAKARRILGGDALLSRAIPHSIRSMARRQRIALHLAAWACLLTAAAHTAGQLAGPRPPASEQEATLQRLMAEHRMPILGMERTLGDFVSGFGWVYVLLNLTLAALAFMLLRYGRGDTTLAPAVVRLGAVVSLVLLLIAWSTSCLRPSCVAPSYSWPSRAPRFRRAPRVPEAWRGARDNYTDRVEWRPSCPGGPGC